MGCFHQTSHLGPQGSMWKRSPDVMDGFKETCLPETADGWSGELYELTGTMATLIGPALFQARRGPSFEKRTWTWAKVTLPKNYLKLITSNKGRLSFLP